MSVVLTTSCFLVASTVLAGLRGAGKYNGVVFFDRWNNCYLFSGVYLMYIANREKAALKPFEGQSIEIDAKLVKQPMNPGDGLITKFVVVGHSKPNASTPSIAGVQVQPTVSRHDRNVRAVIEILSTSASPVVIDADSLGIAVLAHGAGPVFFLGCPSDGSSCAVITRVSAASPDGDNQLGDYVWGWHFSERLPSTFTLRSGESRSTSLLLRVPRGSYQFIAGYGGGVHSGRCVMSNAVSFDIPPN
ncbi:MAG TPA: hypothetical protein VFA04_20800 [Bryobacteraceae bacterium]|nr:hypothetical protein [Bryobacteraceae bacterium]